MAYYEQTLILTLPWLFIWPLTNHFTSGSAGKESTCTEGDLGLIPGLGRSPGEGKDYPFQYSVLENFMDYTGDYKVHGVKRVRQVWETFTFTSISHFFTSIRTTFYHFILKVFSKKNKELYLHSISRVTNNYTCEP